MTDPHPQTEPTAPIPETVPLPTPEAEPGAASVAAHGHERARRSRTALPVLCALGFVLLLAGMYYLWTQQQMLMQQVAEQAQRVVDLSNVPPPPPSVPPATVAALAGRLKVLEQRVNAPAPPTGASDEQVAALALRVAALEARRLPQPDTAGAVAPLAQKLDSVESETAATKSAEAATNARLADLEDRLKQAEQQQAALADRASQASLLAKAQVALAAGEPLGDLPNAPPALARFAQTRPPTEADLRLSFPAAADAAAAASQPSVAGEDLGERMWLRMRSLVTVKRGDKVLVGAPAATVLSEAHARLEAGDLAGAVAALDGLDGKAAQAMAGWRAQAQALLDARAALAQMARA
jgi:hypothetical protein